MTTASLLTSVTKAELEPSPFESTVCNFWVYSRCFICLLVFWSFSCTELHNFGIISIHQTRMKMEDSCYSCTEAFKIAHARYTCLSLIFKWKQCVCWCHFRIPNVLNKQTSQWSLWKQKKIFFFSVKAISGWSRMYSNSRRTSIGRHHGEILLKSADFPRNFQVYF